MLDRRNGLLLAGAGAAGLYLSQGWWAPAEVEFTRAPAAASAGIDMRPAVSTAHVSLAVDLARVARRTEAAVAQRLAMGVDTVDPACAKRPPVADCNAPKLDGTIALSGPVEANAVNGSVRVRVPLKFSVMQGAERASVETAVSFLFKVQSGPGATFEIARVEEPATEGSSGPHARTIRLVESRLKPVALTVQDELRATLAALPVTTAMQRAWNALSQPIELGAGSGNWFKAAPEVAGTGDLATIDGKPVFRIPIAARLSIESGERAAAPQRRPVIQGQVNTAGGAVIRIATPIRLDTVQPAIDNAFVKAGPIETRPDRFGPPVNVEVKRARLYPSVRQIALELDIVASRFEGQTYKGKAHLVGRPVLDIERRLVTLSDITFPPVPQREAASAKTAAGAPRLATDPFAGKLAQAVRFDVARDLTDALPRTSALLHQRLDDRLSLAARADTAAPVSVELSRDGAWLLTDITGALTLTYEGPAEPAQVVASAERPSEPGLPAGRRIATPELTAAAVITAAAAGAIAAQANKPASAPTAAPASGTSSTGQATVTSSASGAEPLPAKVPVAKRVVPATASPSSAQAAIAGHPKPVIRPTVTRVAGKNPGPPQRSDWVPFPSNN